MFKLEEAIAEWRRRMADGGIAPTELDELESHLRDDLRERIRCGMDPYSAWRAATESLGEAASLKQEYELSRTSEDARRLRRFRILCGAGTAAYAACGIPHFLLCDKFGVTDRVVGIAAVFCLSAYVLAGHRIFRRLPVVTSKRRRTVIGLASAILGNLAVVIFFNTGLQRLNLTEGRLIVVVLWSMTLLVMAGSVLHGLDVAAGRETAGADRAG